MNATSINLGAMTAGGKAPKANWILPVKEGYTYRVTPPFPFTVTPSSGSLEPWRGY